MIKILYIGNKLVNKKANLSYIHTLGNLLEGEGFKIFYSSSKINKVLRLADMIWSCLSLSRKVDYVLIDTYSTSNFYYAYIISQLCRLFKLKYIPILHGGNLPNRLKNNPKLSNQIFINAYKNVSPSLYLKVEFKNRGYDDVKYIPNSIEIDKYSFRKINLSSINLLWVRSFSKIYNPSLAVKILEELKKQGYDVNLCMVGPDSDGSMQMVKDQAKSLNVAVTFTGKLSKETWIELSKDYNIFINTTNFDNMPVSVIEAMALGLCVISTNVGGLPYLIANGEDGILVSKDNCMEFVNAIKEAYNNPSQIQEMTLKARQKVEAFNWETVKVKWLELLE